MLNQDFSIGAMPPPPLQIGEWRANRRTNELSRAGSTVRIERKVMEVLMVLADRAGEVVGRDDLLAAVWPGVVVGDDALTQSIIKLRKALGDNPRSPSYIETISKRGYRLIAQVARSDAVPAAHDKRGRAAPTSPASARRGIRSLGMALGTALVLAAAGFYFFASRTQPLPVPHAGAEAADEDKTGFLTVTVLPFETVGAGAEQGYLAQGISSDLMTDLSRLSGLRLIGASGSAAGRHAASTARYVVSGSVQRDGAILRVNVRLTDSRTNEQLWSQRFERPFGDLLAIQNDISRALAGTVAGQDQRCRAPAGGEALHQQPGGVRVFLARSGIVPRPASRGERPGPRAVSKGARSGSAICARLRGSRDDLRDGLSLPERPSNRRPRSARPWNWPKPLE